MKVLMVGVNGRYASLVLPELKKRNIVVRALVRSPEKVEDARKQGADETAIGDLNDSESLHKAATGVEGIFHINPAFAPNEAELGITMVDAAVRAGVRKFVFSGVIHPSIFRMRNHALKQPVEEALYESGLVFTVLQPAMFMQTIANGWQEVRERHSFSLPYSKRAKACYVDYRDVAESAAIAFAGDRLDYGTFELCAPGMVNRIELTSIMSEALGQKIEPGEIPFEEWADRAKIPPGPVREGLQAMYADYDKYGFPGGNSLVLQAILNREPGTLQKFFAELASDGEQQGSAARSNARTAVMSRR